MAAMAQDDEVGDEGRTPERLPKAFYALYYGAGACLFPFVPLYYDQIGLNGDQIGLLAGIPSAMVLIGGALWGGLADATGRHRTVLLLAIGGSIALSQLLPHLSAFFWLIPLVFFMAFFMSPIVPLVDHSVLEMLGGRRARYGKVRMWGAVGWGTVGPLVGWVVERSHLDWAFRSYGLLMALCLLVVVYLPVHAAAPQEPLRGRLREILSDRRWHLFLLLAFTGGVGLGFAHHYLFLYMDELGASRAVMGWALSVATLSELVAFALAERAMQRWGARTLLVVGLLASALRLLAYSLATEPLHALCVQLLHGPSFALMWMAGVSWANRIAPPGTGATAQSLFGGVNFGLGGTAAALAGGALLERVGAAAMYKWGALSVLVGLVVYGVAERAVGRVEEA